MYYREEGGHNDINIEFIIDKFLRKMDQGNL